MKGWTLFAKYGFAGDIAITVWRVIGGFVLAAVCAVPLGIAMGAYKPIEAFFEPFVSFARYLPASAFIPLLILWAGIGEMQKLLVIFIGSFFQVVLMVAVSVGATRRDLVEAAYTLGASSRGVVRRVLLPSAAPAIAETLRLVLGWAWTYVIVAELIGASSGIGHMITDSQALLNTGQIIFGIIVIGVIGLISDFLFKWANQRLFPWSLRRRRMSKLAIEGVGRTFPGVRGGAPTRALQPTTLARRRQRLHHDPRPLGLRQVDVAAHRRRPRHADDRPRAARRQAGGGARRRPRHGVPVLHAVPLAHRAENIGFGLREKAMPQARAGRDRRALRRPGRPRGLRAPLPEDALRRHAAAHGHRPRARQRPEDPAARRAFGALDNQTRALMQELLLGIWEAEKKTVLFVTHDIEEAIFMAARVVVMSARPGRIKAEVAVDLPHPRHYTIKTTPEFSP